MQKHVNIFKELASISVKDKVEKKGNFNYLSWANAWSMLKLKHPQAQRIVYECAETGLNFFTDGKTAYVKVGILVNEMEHIDYLPVMDFRNKSISLEKITSMDVNTTIQRSTAKAIAMHGLGLSLWIGEDIVKVATPIVKAKDTKVKSWETVTLDIGDTNWTKVLSYISKNKALGLPKIIKNLETKYSIKTGVKKELANHVS
tara:strand:- start:3060 stop:3665 length:606 start_codon:yes stop_codon:yes gene_type:complete